MIQIVYYDDKKRKSTGIIAEVLPFGTKDVSIVVRPNYVMLEGCIHLTPEYTRIFGQAIMLAAAVAEGMHVITPGISTSDT